MRIRRQVWLCGALRIEKAIERMQASITGRWTDHRMWYAIKCYHFRCERSQCYVFLLM
jgi:hypothetical protein